MKSSMWQAEVHCKQIQFISTFLPPTNFCNTFTRKTLFNLEDQMEILCDQQLKERHVLKLQGPTQNIENG